MKRVYPDPYSIARAVQEAAAREPRLICVTDYLKNDEWDRGWDKAVEIIEARIRSLDIETIIKNMTLGKSEES